MSVLLKAAGGRGEDATALLPFVVTASIHQSHDAEAGFAQNDASSSDAGDQSDGWQQAKLRIKAIQELQSFVFIVYANFFVSVYFISVVPFMTGKKSLVYAW